MAKNLDKLGNSVVTNNCAQWQFHKNDICRKSKKKDLLFKHFISSLQSSIRSVKYMSVEFKFTLENETCEIFGVILNHNSFHIDKALPCRRQIKEQLYILMRLAIPFGKFQNTTAYSCVYVFVLVLMILKV